MPTQPANNLTPKLRFHEFRNKGQWVLKPLSEIAMPINERAGKSKCTPYTVTTGVGLISQDEKYGRSIAGKSYKNYYRLKHNDFAYNKSATKAFPQGYIARYLEHGPAAVPNSIFTCFRVDEQLINPEYLDYQFQNNLHGNWLQKYITVGARAHGALNVNDSDLMALPVPIPPKGTQGDELAEQKKIADCLSSLDELIAAETQKLDALRDHKKGLMQQLFPKPGKSQPELRFPEFRDASAWKMQQLRNVCDRIMDGTHFSPKSKSGPRPYLTSKNIRNGRLDLSTVSFISEKDHKEIYKRCPVQFNDVLLTKDGASTGNCTINNIDYEFSLLSSVAVIRGNSKLLTQQFLYQSIVSDRIQRLIIGSMSGQAITRITLTKLGEYPIAYPCIEEQEHIAACLSSIDDQINAQTQKIEFLKDHKQGLMQQLFPKPEVS